jgi:hypothetical protein
VAIGVGAWGCNAAQSGPEACISAGGQCLLGPAVCAIRGPQDCNPDRNPGGAFCCLSQTADCGQPLEITYVCPSPSDAGGTCKGAPPAPPGAPNYASLADAADVDASFASGCMATFPVCTSGKAYECTCGAFGNQGSWSCVY